MALEALQKELKGVMDELSVLDAKESWTNDEQTTVDALLEKSAALQADIERTKKISGARDYANKSAGMIPLAKVESVRPSGDEIKIEDDGDNVTAEGMKACFSDRQWKAIHASEYKAAFREYVKGGMQGLNRDAHKALQEGLDVSGGYLVPEDMLQRLIAKDPAPTSIASRVTRLNTSKDVLVMPKVTYTTDDKYVSGMRVTWTGEVPASATAHRVTDPTFGEDRIPIFTVTMSLPVTNDLIDDAAYDIVGWCQNQFRIVVDQTIDDMIIEGNGALQPKGILANPGTAPEPTTVNSGAAAALTADGIVDLTYAIPPQYDGRANFCFNKVNAAKAIAKLKDGDGRYIWGAGMQDSGLLIPAIRQQLLGYDVVYNEFMPNVAANTYPIIFGDFSGYYLVNRLVFSIQVLRELYAETNQVLILGRARFGGKVVEDWKLKVQKVSA